MARIKARSYLTLHPWIFFLERTIKLVCWLEVIHSVDKKAMATHLEVPCVNPNVDLSSDPGAPDVIVSFWSILTKNFVPQSTSVPQRSMCRHRRP